MRDHPKQPLDERLVALAMAAGSGRIRAKLLAAAANINFENRGAAADPEPIREVFHDLLDGARAYGSPPNFNVIRYVSDALQLAEGVSRREIAPLEEPHLPEQPRPPVPEHREE